MSRFGKCDKCSCNLDPGEKCSCGEPEEPKEPKKERKLFERGRDYIFSKMEFQKKTAVHPEDIEASWPGWLDGVRVIPTNEHTGTCGAVTVFPEWCKEVEA